MRRCSCTVVTGGAAKRYTSNNTSQSAKYATRTAPAIFATRITVRRSREFPRGDDPISTAHHLRVRRLDYGSVVRVDPLGGTRGLVTELPQIVDRELFPPLWDGRHSPHLIGRFKGEPSLTE